MEEKNKSFAIGGAILILVFVLIAVALTNKPSTNQSQTTTTQTSSQSVLVINSSSANITGASAKDDTFNANSSYTAIGSYSAPSGNEEIEVTVSLENNIIKTVTVTPKAGGGISAKYQKEFAEGVSSIVVGKNINGVSVAKVAGSSLTPKGFNAALTTIKQQIKS